MYNFVCFAVDNECCYMHTDYMRRYRVLVLGCDCALQPKNRPYNTKKEGLSDS